MELQAISMLREKILWQFALLSQLVSFRIDEFLLFPENILSTVKM